MPEISIIIPTIGQQWLSSAIRSALAQADVEVIVVGDRYDLSSRGDLDSKVRIARSNEGGVCGARNVGLAMATGRWIHFLDEDDRMAPNAMASQMAVGAGCDLVFHRVQAINEIGQVVPASSIQPWIGIPEDCVDLTECARQWRGWLPPTACWIMRREAWEHTKFEWDVEYAEGGNDVMFLVAAMKAKLNQGVFHRQGGVQKRIRRPSRWDQTTRQRALAVSAEYFSS